MIKYLACSLLPVALLLVSCKDSNIGADIRPKEDVLAVKTDSFPLETKTIYAGALYSESEKPVLGCYSDNVFGSFKVDFLSEFRYIRDLTFTKSAVGDSLQLVMYYKTFFGDSSAVQEVTAFQLDKMPLNFSENYKSDISVDEFCSKNIMLGSQRYVAYDKTVNDSVRSSADYCNSIRVSMPETLMEGLMTKTEIYKSQDDFVNFLKGVYVTNTYGRQTVLEIDSVNLEMFYHYTDTLVSKNTGKRDSMVTRYSKVLFPANRETTTVIHIAESNPVNIETIPDSIEYISAPGGTFVEVNIPYEDIYQRVVVANAGKNDGLLNFNYFSLFMEEAEMEDYSLRTTVPIYFILIRKADVDTFFVQSLYPVDNINTTLGVYGLNMNPDGYTFNNNGYEIENIMNKAKSFSSEKDRKDYFDGLNPYWIIPVSGVTDIAGTNATVRHLFDTYGIRVRSGSNKNSPMRMVVTYTNL